MSTGYSASQTGPMSRLMNGPVNDNSGSWYTPASSQGGGLVDFFSDHRVRALMKLHNNTRRTLDMLDIAAGSRDEREARRAALFPLSGSREDLLDYFKKYYE